MATNFSNLDIVKTTKVSSEFLNYTKNFSKDMNSNLDIIDPLGYLYMVMDTMHMFRILESEIDCLILSESEKRTVYILKKYKNWEYIEPQNENYVVFSTLRSEKFGIKYALLKPKESRNIDVELSIIYSAILPNKNITKSIYKIFMKIANKLCANTN